MKIVVTATAPDIDSVINPRFGRAGYFVVLDVDTLEWRASPNPAVNASGGAGTQAAQFIVDQDVQAIISGDFGPNAYNALNAAGVDMYLFGQAQTVREAAGRFKEGNLTLVGITASAQHRQRN